MSASKAAGVAGPECGMIVQQDGKPQQVLAKFLNLMLNYQYGLSVVLEQDPSKAVAQLLKGNVRCVFLIQNQEIKSVTTITALSRQGSTPLFLIVPQAQLANQQLICAGMDNIHYCSWQKAFSQSEESLQFVATSALDENGIGDLFSDIEKIPYPVIQQRIERRLRNINTLPTLPEIVMRIMRMVNDPKTTTDELEQVLCTDPAIVMKLLQVMKSPVFGGTVQRGKWTLNEIIVRLGLKKVGAIAQQIKLINSLVKPQESEFDLQRFWVHSVGTAIIADKLYTKKLVPIKAELGFTDYWIGALLHDAGKLVLGFFFWDWFSRVLEHAENSGSFRRAEARLGDPANHERLGQLLLINANMGEEVAGVVGTHHGLGEEPAPLACLVHLANQLSKDLGMGYLPDEAADYSEEVLKVLDMKPEDVESLKESLAEDTTGEVKSMVDQCL